MRVHGTGDRRHTRFLASAQAGITLVEVLVAVLLMTIGAIGAAQLLGMAVTATASARRQTSTAMIAGTKIEQLRALLWAYELGPGGTPGRRVSDLTTDLSVDPPGDGGPGLGHAPSMALERNMPPYVDYVDASGAWVGHGPTPPPVTAFIRRWAVTPLAGSPDVLALQVVVVPLHREQRGRAPGRSLADGTHLVTLRTRRAR